MSFVSPELERMAERAKLPIHVTFTTLGSFGICCRKPDGEVGLAFGRHPEDATRAYLALVETLSPPESSPTAGPATDCSALTSPGVR